MRPSLSRFQFGRTPTRLDLSMPLGETCGMTKPTIVFDLDGTLVDTAPDILGTLDDILTRENVPLLPREEALAFIGIGSRAMLERALTKAGHGTEPERIESLFRDFLDHYATRLANESRPFPGAIEALDALRESGHRLAICTNKMEGHSILLIEQLGLSPYFRAICGRDTFDYCKPDGRHIASTIVKAEGDPAHAIMVGDTITDFDAARNAGIPSIGVRFGYSDRPMDDLNPDAIIEHYDALSAAISSLTLNLRK
jgi:phosphoglycolate phosphatase